MSSLRILRRALTVDTGTEQSGKDPRMSRHQFQVPFVTCRTPSSTTEFTVTTWHGVTANRNLDCINSRLQGNMPPVDKIQHHITVN